MIPTCMKPFVHHVRARPHLTAAVLVGAATALLLPPTLSPRVRALLGWNVAVWAYLALAMLSVARTDAGHIKRVALAQAEGAGTVLLMVIVASVVSLAGTVLELSAAKAAGTGGALPHVALALSTVLGSWLLLPTVFALHYASLHFHAPKEPGLIFPAAPSGFSPSFGDFLYFSFTIAAAAQTADVAVGTARLRRWVLVQSVLSFAFNTAILAFTVNVAASLF